MLVLDQIVVDVAFACAYRGPVGSAGDSDDGGGWRRGADRGDEVKAGGAIGGALEVEVEEDRVPGFAAEGGEGLAGSVRCGPERTYTSYSAPMLGAQRP